MAMFRLNLNECGCRTYDEEGVEAASTDEAREIALKAARGMMAAEVMKGDLCLSCSIDIANDEGEVIMCVPFREALTITGL